MFHTFLACYLQIDANPDPAYHFDADPDQAHHFNADPDSTFQFDADTCGSGSATPEGGGGGGGQILWLV
jgi:hypothetical protein